MPIRNTLAAAAAATALAAAAFAAPAGAQKYSLKMTSYVPLNSGAWNTYMAPFIDAVNVLTNGEVEVKGFGVGVLAGPFDGWKAVQKKTADICFCYPGFALNADPANGIFAGMVGGMGMEPFMHWFMAGDGTKLLTDMRHQTMEVHPVVTGFGTTEIFLHSHKKVEKIEDLKGMKIRTAGAWADILAKLGASATVIPPADIYTALERRVIDATEFITPSTNIKVGFHKVAKYIIVPGAHSPSHMNEAVFRLADWKAMPKRLQDQITAAGELAGYRSGIREGVDDLDAIEKLKAGPNEWVSLAPETIAKIEELARAWSDEKAKAQLAAGNPWMDRVSKSYWSFFDRWKKYGFYRL